METKTLIKQNPEAEKMLLARMLTVAVKEGRNNVELENIRSRIVLAYQKGEIWSHNYHSLIQYLNHRMICIRFKNGISEDIIEVGLCKAVANFRDFKKAEYYSYKRDNAGYHIQKYNQEDDYLNSFDFQLNFLTCDMTILTKEELCSQ